MYISNVCISGVRKYNKHKVWGTFPSWRWSMCQSHVCFNSSSQKSIIQGWEKRCALTWWSPLKYACFQFLFFNEVHRGGLHYKLYTFYTFDIYKVLQLSLDEQRRNRFIAWPSNGRSSSLKRVTNWLWIRLQFETDMTLTNIEDKPIGTRLEWKIQLT